LRQLEELELTNCPGSSPELVSYLRQGIEPDLKRGGGRFWATISKQITKNTTEHYYLGCR
jgi:hypothetical protein